MFNGVFCDFIESLQGVNKFVMDDPQEICYTPRAIFSTMLPMEAKINDEFESLSTHYLYFNKLEPVTNLTNPLAGSN